MAEIFWRYCSTFSRINLVSDKFHPVISCAGMEPRFVFELMKASFITNKLFVNISPQRLTSCITLVRYLDKQSPSLNKYWPVLGICGLYTALGNNLVRQKKVHEFLWREYKGNTVPPACVSNGWKLKVALLALRDQCLPTRTKDAGLSKWKTH